jgi:hypothetical protein
LVLINDGFGSIVLKAEADAAAARQQLPRDPAHLLFDGHTVVAN